MADVEASENDSLYDLVQAKKKLPSLSWKQKVIGFAITAGLAAFFAILVSEFNVSCLTTFSSQQFPTQRPSLPVFVYL